MAPHPLLDLPNDLLLATVCQNLASGGEQKNRGNERKGAAVGGVGTDNQKPNPTNRTPLRVYIYMDMCMYMHIYICIYINISMYICIYHDD